MMSEALDRTVSVRPGEGLDVDALRTYLERELPELTGPLEIRQFPGGASNLTYLLRSGDREWVLRRPPPGARAKAAHDVVREARLMQGLSGHVSFVPRVHHICSDTSILGGEFYVMELLRGVILRRDLPPGLSLDPAAAGELCRSLYDRLIELHSVDVQAAGLAGFGRGEGYVKRQIEGWTEWYGKARTDDSPTYEGVIAWLRERMPARESRICVIHNDFRFDNVVLDPARNLLPIGVLDWELATLGDPLMDLGTSLAYWIEAGDSAELLGMRRQPSHLPGMLTRRDIVDYYQSKTGSEITDVAFYQVYGLFRLAGIAQQIYARFRRGMTHNPELEAFGGVARDLEKRCHEVMEGAR
jgi:aminoglycoside phosphotransferase (APT) family kinase protein